MTTTMLWKKFDCITDDRAFLMPNDDCYYARDFISGGGFSASTDNNLISNFKKPMSRKGQNDWPYKGKAINQFAADLLTILPDNAVVSAIPTSKAKNDPAYDPRLEATLAKVVNKNSTIRIEQPIERTQTVKALHQGGKRNINEVLQTLKWIGFDDIPDHIVLIDDVITTGSNFKACKQLIHKHHPGLTVLGVFWARTVWTTTDN